MEDLIMLPIYAKTSNLGFFPSFFNDFFNDSWITPQFHSTSPAINVSEDDKGYKLEIAAPGMTKEDFNISISDGDIVIAMEKKNENKDENKEKKYIRREFSYSNYQQNYSLPEDVVKDNISARVENGILTVTLPKQEKEAKVSKSIEIS